MLVLSLVGLSQWRYGRQLHPRTVECVVLLLQSPCYGERVPRNAMISKYPPGLLRDQNLLEHAFNSVMDAGASFCIGLVGPKPYQCSFEPYQYSSEPYRCFVSTFL